jgi:hypothetical protein
MVAMKPNKGDVILICILFATLSFFVVNEFNILAGFEQFSSNFTTLFAIIFGGELLSFALYKIGMAKYKPKDEKGADSYFVYKQTPITGTVVKFGESIDIYLTKDPTALEVPEEIFTPAPTEEESETEHQEAETDYE